MFGRAPMPFPSQPNALQGTYPARQPMPPAMPEPPPANPQWAGANPSRPAAPRPIIRAQAEDPPSPPNRLALRLPSPEELGIPAAKSDAAEKTFDQRLQSLGARGLRVEPLAEGGFRAYMVLPGDRPVQAEGHSQAVATNLALDRAELALGSPR